MKEKTADIDILEELKKWFNNFDLDSIKHKPEEYIQAISTLIAENKELKEETEGLKDRNKKLQDKAKELIFEKQELTSALLHSTPNEKIKAKIEEMDNIISQNEKIIFNGRYEHLHTLTEARIVKGELQSLLGKE